MQRYYSTQDPWSPYIHNDYNLTVWGKSFETIDGKGISFLIAKTMLVTYTVELYPTISNTPVWLKSPSQHCTDMDLANVVKDG